MNKGIGALAVVLPRYGESLGGGAETLARAVALALWRAKLVQRLEIWSTCALDHRTWDNHFPCGETVEDGLTVRRFPVDGRNLETFIRSEIALSEGRKLTVEEQLDWLANSVNSGGLYQHIAEHGAEFDGLIFAPYLFATSFWGSLIHPDKSLVIPCLHDEHYAYQPVFRVQFQAVRGLLFNSRPELELAKKIYQLPDIEAKSAVVGMGFEPETAEIEETGIDSPFLLYSGRKEKGKNLDVLLDYFEALLKAFPDLGVKLVIIGSGEISFRESLPEGTIDLGFVSEGRKRALMRNAVALCQPSTNESFSIVMMEAWLEATPVLVHALCPVTKDHVVKSGGGLYFGHAAEFACAVKTLLEGGELRRRMGEAGRRYVETEYCWPSVLERLTGAFRLLGLSGSDSQTEAYGR